jgi:hypothetical protein
MQPGLLARLYSLLSVLCLGACSNLAPPGGDPGKGGAEIAEVVKQVKDALSDVQTELAQSNLPQLKAVKLSLKTAIESKAGGSFKLVVITIGGTKEESSVQQIDVTLVPPNPGNPKQISTQSVTKALEDAILSAARGVRDAGAGTVPLKVSEVTVSLNFSVKDSGNAGMKLELVPITPELSGSLSKTTVQNLAVTFGK